MLPNQSPGLKSENIDDMQATVSLPTQTPSINPEPPQDADNVLSSLTSNNARITVNVYQDGITKTWKIHRDLLCCYSRYFESRLPNGAQPPRDGYPFAVEKVKDFGKVVEWLYSNKSTNGAAVKQKYRRHKELPRIHGLPSKYDPFWDIDFRHTRKRCLSVIRFYLVAEKLEIMELQHYLLNYFVANVLIHLTGEEFEYIYEKTKNVISASPLRMFCSRWITEICYDQPKRHIRDGFSLRINQMSDEAQNTLKAFERKDCDPRVFDIEHWFRSCASKVETCGHVHWGGNIRMLNWISGPFGGQRIWRDHRAKEKWIGAWCVGMIVTTWMFSPFMLAWMHADLTGMLG